MKRNFKKLLLYGTLIGMISLGPLFSSSANAAVGDTIADTFPDQALAQVVADAVSGGDVNAPLTQSMVDNYKLLDGATTGIQDLTGIETLVNLEKVVLNGNEITSLPDTMAQLTKLKVADLNRNKLTHLPENIVNISTLTHLYLDNNQLTHLPEDIDALDNLYYLRAASNQLTRLPDNIGGLYNLQYLDVNYNKLVEIPESIGDFEYLWHFGGEGNQLTSLPSSFSNLLLLGEVELADNLLPTGYADVISEMEIYNVYEEPQRQVTLKPTVNPYFITHESDITDIDLWELVNLSDGSSLLPQHQLILDNHVDENGQPVSISDYIENGEVIKAGKVFIKVRAIGTGMFPNTSDRAASLDPIELNFLLDSGDGGLPQLPPPDEDGDGDKGDTLIPPTDGNGTLTASTDTAGSDKANTEAPQTGDNMSLLGLTLLLVSSLGVLVGISKKRQRDI